MKHIIATLVFANIFLPTAAFAASLTPAQIQAVVSLLSSFGADTTVVANVQASLGGQPSVATPVSTALNTLTQTLTLGTSNDEVADLQRYLAQRPEIYPEGLVTGYFGPRTEQAVKKLQESNGLPPVGIVGPKTRSVINTAIAGGAVNNSVSSPQTAPIAPVTPPASITPPSSTPNPSTGTYYGGWTGGGINPSTPIFASEPTPTPAPPPPPPPPSATSTATSTEPTRPY